MSVTRLWFGVFEDSLWNFADPPGVEDDAKPEDVLIQATSDSSRLQLTLAKPGVSMSIEVMGTFPSNVGTLPDIEALLKIAPKSSVSKLVVTLNGRMMSMDEFFPTVPLDLLLGFGVTTEDQIAPLYAGNDTFIGSPEPQQIDSDQINGYAGDDLFTGYGDAGVSRGRPDIFFGGSGVDTSTYRGLRSEYTVEKIDSIWHPGLSTDIATNGTGFRVRDSHPERDGIDLLYGVEILRFMNGESIDLRGLYTPTNSGSTTPASSGQGTSSSGSGSAGSTTTGTGASSGGTSGTTTGSTSTTTTSTTTTTTPVVTTPVAPIIPNGTEKNGSDTVDRLQGGSGPDVIRSGGGSDVIIGSDGNDYIDGGTGVDQLSYSSRAGSISFAVDTGGNVQVRLGSKTDTLVSVERVSFTDKAYALDLDGSAGKAAKAVIAAFGKNTVSQYLGIALTMTDKGSSVADLAKIVIDNKMLPSDNGQFVQTVFNNVVGRAPNALELLQFKGILDRGEMTSTQLLTLAAQSTFTDTVINEVAIAGVALEYQPTLSI